MKYSTLTTLSALSLALALPLAASGQDAPPGLAEIAIGDSFPAPGVTWDTRRPTTQFRVPNFGPTKVIFPDYQVAVLNATKKVTIATGEATTTSRGDCEKKLDAVIAMVKQVLPNHASVPASEAQLGTASEYLSASDNRYFVAKCYGDAGPYPILHLQFRGKMEDKLLKQAWEDYFSANKR